MSVDSEGPAASPAMGDYDSSDTDSETRKEREIRVVPSPVSLATHTFVFQYADI